MKVSINEDSDVEPERLDAVGELTSLLCAVTASVLRVRLQAINPGGVIGMGRTEATSGQAAKRPMAETSEASLPCNVPVLSIVADLEGRDLDGLRRQWRAHLGGEAAGLGCAGSPTCSE